MLREGWQSPAFLFFRPMKRLRALLPLLVLFAIGVLLLASGALERFDPHDLAADEARLRGDLALHPWLGALVQVFATALVVATGVPGGIVLVLAGGMLFGTVVGTLLSSTGAVLGASLLFLASRRAFAAGTRPPPTLATRLRAGYLAHPFSYTMFLRLVPLFPFGATSIALAWLGCPPWLFLIATAIGGTVMIAFESALGAGLSATIAREGTVSLSVLAHREILLPLLGIALLALAPVAVGAWRDRRARATTGNGPDD